MRSLFFRNRAERNEALEPDTPPRKRPMSCAVEVKGIKQPVTIRENPRARRMTLRVSGTHRSAVLTVPPHADLKDANKFLQKHADWIKRKLSDLPKAVVFSDGEIIPFRGVRHQIAFVGNQRHKSVVWLEPGREASSADAGEYPLICVKGAQAHAPRRLLDWLKAEARRDLTDACDFHAARLGLTYSKLAIRDQATRWGSCSSTGTLSFSWRLILAPHFVLDYVAAHEVAHLREMNHSPAFWSLVKATLPEMDQGRQWLKRYGIDLHAYWLYFECKTGRFSPWKNCS